MSNDSLPMVVLVEDEEMDVRHFRRVALQQELKNELTVFSTGDEAFKFLKTSRGTSPPRVVLTDINMPGMNGHELIEAIRADSDLGPTVIFVLSTSDMPLDLERAYSSHVAGYIVKDAAGRGLVESVQMLKHYSRSVKLPP